MRRALVRLGRSMDGGAGYGPIVNAAAEPRPRRLHGRGDVRELIACK